tara:strand:+ start:41335 stop:42120 length:786 start_codon:yes stop_codon:yes gene_type:complete
MAILKQSNDTQLIYQGWYGLCNENDTCESFPLVTGSGMGSSYVHNSIKYIFEVSENSEGSIMYDGSLTFGGAIGTIAIKELKCGRCYQIIMKRGSEELNIPQFSHSNFSTTEQKKITDSCVVVETPTPVPQPELTPTPTPTPKDCCVGSDFSYTIVNGQSGGDNNVTVRTQGLNSQDATWDGTLCWEELTVNSNDTVNYLIDLRVNDSVTESLGMINIILNAKYEDQKFTYTLESNGVCYTGEMKNTNELGQGGMNIWTPM